MSEVVVAEECRENFRMSRGNYHGLNVLLTGACSKRDKAVVPPIKRCSVDAEHIIRFHVWTENFCSFFAPKVAFSNLSGIVWTRPKYARRLEGDHLSSPKLNSLSRQANVEHKYGFPCVEQREI